MSKCRAGLILSGLVVICCEVWFQIVFAYVVWQLQTVGICFRGLSVFVGSCKHAANRDICCFQKSLFSKIPIIA